MKLMDQQEEKIILFVKLENSLNSKETGHSEEMEAHANYHLTQLMNGVP
jgi:hypothetical protein